MSLRKFAALGLMAAPLALTLAPAQAAAPAPAPLETIITGDPAGDRDVFAPSVREGITSSIELTRTVYTTSESANGKNLVVKMNTKGLIPAASDFDQTFSVTGASRDGTQGFMLFHTPGDAAAVLVAKDVRPASCDLATATSKDLDRGRSLVTFTVPMDCVSAEKALKLSTSALVTGAGDRVLAQDVTDNTQLVRIG